MSQRRTYTKADNGASLRMLDAISGKNEAAGTQAIDLAFFRHDALWGEEKSKYRLYAKMKQYISCVARSCDEYEASAKEAARLCNI